MFRIVVLSLAVISLSACGGGNTNTREVDQLYDNTGTNSSSEIKAYTVGEQVVILALKGHIQGDVTPNDTKYYFTMTDDKNFVEDSFSGAIVWTEVSGETVINETGTGYELERTGVNSSGDTFRASTSGLNLNLSGTEYVSLSVVQAAENVSLLTTGTTVVSLPEGTFSFNKSINGLLGVQDTLEPLNQLNLTANFTNLSGSLTAVSDNLYMSSTNFEINSQTGSFSGGVSEIGELNTTFSVSADILGAFAGRNAGAVHGFMYNDGENVEDGIGIFMAHR
jgi:hypothetical protein